MVLYDCVDDLVQFGGQRMLVEEERLLLPRVDLVVTCMDNVRDDKVGRGAPVTCIPNGVDAEHFRPGVVPPSPVAALRSLPHPIVGYSGVLYDRIDWALVELACRMEPSWSFVFMGRVETPPPPALASLANLHILGEVSFETLPTYYAATDVCWIPHLVNDLTRRQSSLKVYEYLAAGVPAVSTDLPLAPDVLPLVLVGRTGAEVVAALRKAMASDTGERRQARFEVASRNSWRARFELLSAHLAEVRA
jgi:glycosyltransferase involved in cell wall biosynthesis